MSLSDGQLEETVCTLLEKQCGEYVSRDRELLASGVIGSFQLFEFICELEETLGIQFPQEDLKEIHHFSSVNAIVDTVKNIRLNREGKRNVVYGWNKMV